MAMTINENPMNPVPLWTSKYKWQCNQKTFHDAMAWPVVQNGVLPKMALTVSGDMPAAESCTVKIEDCDVASLNRVYAGISSNPDGTSTVSLTGTENRGEINPPNPMPRLEFVPQNRGTYKITIISGEDEYEVKHFSSGGDVFTSEELMSKDDIMCTFVDASSQLPTFHSFKMSNVDISYRAQVTIPMSLKKLTDDTTAFNTSYNERLSGCTPYYSSDRKGYLWFGGSGVQGTFADGVYYMELTVDSNKYYSEPFLWMTNLSNFTHITFRRSDVIVTKTNYIDFTDRTYNTYHTLSMYLRNIDQRPPYQFNPEVTDIDGRKFAEKQVSYYNRRIAFNCYEAFLEAIRLLWHCDIRYMGNRRIDYMEPPEMDWNTDNHLCDVVLEMSNYDDVLQTNGTASSYFDSSDSSHQSYDASFDESFD